MNKGPAIKTVLGIVFTAGIIAVVVTYQNCGSSGSGSFNINTQNNASQNISVSSLSLSPTTVAPSQTLTGSSQINGTPGDYNCQWMFVTNPGGNVVPPAIPSTVASSSVCSVSTTAPASAGGYSLILTASLGSMVAQPVGAAFTVSGSSSPTPTPTATPTATPTPTPKPSPTPFSPGYYCSCSSGPGPICSGADLSGQTCYLGGLTWNCSHCPNYCSVNPYSCR